MTDQKNIYFSDAQLKDEMDKCEYCSEKPCQTACPSNCSPADFIMAASEGRSSDYIRAAKEILSANPLGEVCGVVCPDTFCVAACSKSKFGNPLNIPKIQATIVKKARGAGFVDKPEEKSGEKRVAVVGAGPAGLGAASILASEGHKVTIYDQERKAGGAARLIAKERLPSRVVDDDRNVILRLDNVEQHFGEKVEPASLLKDNDAVVVTTGLSSSFRLDVEGAGEAVDFKDYLLNPAAHKDEGAVAIIGGGAVAVDCAIVARDNGAKSVEMFILERQDEMPLTSHERGLLIEKAVDVSTRQRVVAIKKEGDLLNLDTMKVRLEGDVFRVDKIKDEEGTLQCRKGYSKLVFAIGARAEKCAEAKGLFFAGDCEHGASTVVEAVASGKNTANRVCEFLAGESETKIENSKKSTVVRGGYNFKPADLTTDFFGTKIISPFLLAAAPPSDGFEQMKMGYEAGWAGGVMKTAFDNIPIHIPSEYMFAFDKSTYANCDNVSGHSLDRVCKEIEELVKLYPDRLTMGSTGGPVSGDDEADRKQWLANTKKLENCGAKGIEFSLSCPQGGDGTKGDIVSQDAELTAKIIDWVLAGSDPSVPKLFKLTPAVTTIKPIIMAIEEVLAKHPKAKAGVTLANTFPVLGFRKAPKRTWEEGIIVGMSGSGVMPISCLTLANVSGSTVPVSGNGGAMTYMDAAHFLALGAKTVQFCTAVMKSGYSIIDELESGIAHLMEARGMKTMADLIGSALPNPVTGFEELSPVKKISARYDELCVSCGNCTRCPYYAVTLDENHLPVTDPAKCVGCSICVKKCFAGALHMKERSKKEMILLKED